MANPLLSVPGLGGYVAQRQMNEQGALGQLQQAQAVLGLQGVMEKRAQEEAFRQELAQAPDDAARQAIALKYASPDKALDIQSRTADRREAAEARATQFAETLNLRQQALEDRKAAAEQRITDSREKAQFDQWYKQQQLTLQQSQQAINRSLAEMGMELRRQGNQITLERFNVAERQQLTRQVQQLGTALERANLPEADAVLRGVEEAMKKTPRLAEYLSGPLSATPDLAVGALTPGMKKEEADAIRDGRQAFQKLFNITLKNRSGAAVTNQELERLKQEFATGVFKTPEQLQGAANQARKIISDHYKSVAAGFGANALKAYNDNLREVGGTPLLEGDAAPAPARQNSGWSITPVR